MQFRICLPKFRNNLLAASSFNTPKFEAADSSEMPVANKLPKWRFNPGNKSRFSSQVPFSAVYSPVQTLRNPER
jgi:hypothetical protein